MSFFDYYISPTAVDDPESDWTDKAYTIDGNPQTYGYSSEIVPGTWSEYLYFSHTGLLCDGACFKASEQSPVDYVDIDLYYDDAWQPFYEGAWIADVTRIANWTKSMYPAKVVTGGRIRFKGVGAATIPATLYEFWFHQESPLLFGLIGDIHISDAADMVWNQFQQNEYRRFSTASTRLGDFLTTINDNIDPVHGFSIDCGDILDSHSTPAQVLTLMAGYNDAIIDLRDVPHRFAIGNHLKWMIDSREDITWAQYFAALSNEGARANGFPDSENPKAYTFDVGGFRCIVLYYTYLNYVEGAEGDDQRAWLTARLAETDRPVIVFCHAYLHTQMHQYGNPGYAYYGSDDTYLAPVRTILEEKGKVQAVFSSHYHRAKSNAVINGIPYIGLAGSIHAPLADDNAYYIVEVTPNAFQGPNQWHSRIKMTGYGTKAFDYRGDIGIAM